MLSKGLHCMCGFPVSRIFCCCFQQLRPFIFQRRFSYWLEKKLAANSLQFILHRHDDGGSVDRNFYVVSLSSFALTVTLFCRLL